MGWGDKMPEEYRKPRHYMGGVSDGQCGREMFTWLEQRFHGVNMVLVEESEGSHPFCIYVLPSNDRHKQDVLNLYCSNICDSIRAFEAGWKAARR